VAAVPLMDKAATEGVVGGVVEGPVAVLAPSSPPPPQADRRSAAEAAAKA
jgi:hypothetical protein